MSFQNWHYFCGYLYFLSYSFLEKIKIMYFLNAEIYLPRSKLCKPTSTLKKKSCIPVCLAGKNWVLFFFLARYKNPQKQKALNRFSQLHFKITWIFSFAASIFLRNSLCNFTFKATSDRSLFSSSCSCFSVSINSTFACSASWASFVTFREYCFLTDLASLPSPK